MPLVWYKLVDKNGRMLEGTNYFNLQLDANSDIMDFLSKVESSMHELTVNVFRNIGELRTCEPLEKNTLVAGLGSSAEQPLLVMVHSEDVATTSSEVSKKRKTGMFNSLIQYNRYRRSYKY